MRIQQSSLLSLAILLLGVMGASPAAFSQSTTLLRGTISDPQGKAIKHSVELLGFNGISDIRQGKYFEIAIEGPNLEQARAEAVRMAHDVLSNPIIEDFRVEIEE